MTRVNETRLLAREGGAKFYLRGENGGIRNIEYFGRHDMAATMWTLVNKSADEPSESVHMMKS